MVLTEISNSIASMQRRKEEKEEKRRKGRESGRRGSYLVERRWDHDVPDVRTDNCAVIGT